MIKVIATLRGWQPISSAPFDSQLALAALDVKDRMRLCFHAHRILGGWVDATTRERINISPTTGKSGWTYPRHKPSALPVLVPTG